ncbi:MAG: glycine/sarcosine/betaine reductase selenoprotein B family protein [Acidimicrobiales bacterium]
MTDPQHAPGNPEPVDYIEVTRSTYDAMGYPTYGWVHNEDPPALVPLTKPLSACKVALIASGGVYRTGQIAFHYRDDLSYRIIPADTADQDLRATHFAYDVRDARQDIGVVFPLRALRQLASEGVIGGVCGEAYTFMGGIYSARRVREELAPALLERVREQGADVALLVPV